MLALPTDQRSYQALDVNNSIGNGGLINESNQSVPILDNQRHHNQMDGAVNPTSKLYYNHPIKLNGVNKQELDNSYSATQQETNRCLSFTDGQQQKGEYQLASLSYRPIFKSVCDTNNKI